MADQLSCIRRSASAAANPAAVAAELHRDLDQPGICLVVVFLSAACDLDALAAALHDRFGAVPVIGCTTAGELSSRGYQLGTVIGLSLAAPDFSAAAVLLRDLRHFNLAAGTSAVRGALQALRRAGPGFRRGQMFGFTLIDGLSNCEEAVVSALHGVMGEIPLCGGSAGDCLRFTRTLVLHDGKWHADSALFVLVATTRPFHAFKTEHFIVGNERSVVTAAEPARRIVTEINAEPAAREYARVVGLEIERLTPMIFANHPMVVRVGGANFVRSIQKVNDDESLTFFCAIDEGIVLRVAQGIDLAENLDELFSSLRATLGPPALTLGFDCILRGLEMDETHIRDRVGHMMAANNVFGFATYGEQFQAMHVNQTFTGIAIGERRPG